mmetsp:Transcript_103741/g.293245  ORF Transcript_103741/g.293245 Transcript_103741/m.293245 type:complete len:263 (+) Transcript_103741:348-1136(+)
MAATALHSCDAAAAPRPMWGRALLPVPASASKRLTTTPRTELGRRQSSRFPCLHALMKSLPAEGQVEPSGQHWLPVQVPGEPGHCTFCPSRQVCAALGTGFALVLGRAGAAGTARAGGTPWGLLQVRALPSWQPRKSGAAAGHVVWSGQHWLPVQTAPVPGHTALPPMLHGGLAGGTGPLGAAAGAGGAAGLVGPAGLGDAAAEGAAGARSTSADSVGACCGLVQSVCLPVLQPSKPSAADGHVDPSEQHWVPAQMALVPGQ